MKKFLRAVAVAALAATTLPMVGQAQQNVQVRVATVADWTIPAGPGGGQFKLQTQNPSLGDLLAYCIDPTRVAPWVTFRDYRMYTFEQYVAATLGGNFVNSQSMDDLAKMVLNAQTIQATGGVNLPPANAAQQNSWQIFRGTINAPAGLANSVDTRNWRVLVSVDGIGTGDSPTNPALGYQTFITTVPEPSTYVLLAVGMAGMALVARRRRNV